MKKLICLFLLLFPLSVFADPPRDLKKPYSKIGACKLRDGNAFQIISTQGLNNGNSGYFLKQNKKLYYEVVRRTNEFSDKHALYMYDCMKKKDSLLLTEKDIDDLLKNSKFSYSFIQIIPQYDNGYMYITIEPSSTSITSNDYPDSILNFQMSINWMKKKLSLIRMNNGNLYCYDQQKDKNIFCGKPQVGEKQINIQF